MKKIQSFFLPLFLIVLIPACVGLNRSTYNAQKLATDTVAGAVSGYNQYLGLVTNQMSGQALISTLAQRDKIYADVRKFAQIDATVTTLRLAYKANSSDTNKAALNIVMGTLTDASFAIAGEVKAIIGGK